MKSIAEGENEDGEGEEDDPEPKEEAADSTEASTGATKETGDDADAWVGDNKYPKEITDFCLNDMDTFDDLCEKVRPHVEFFLQSALQTSLLTSSIPRRRLDGDDSHSWSCHVLSFHTISSIVSLILPFDE